MFFSVNSEVACDGEEGRERCDTWFALPAGRISSDAFRRKAKGATAASKAKAAGVAGAPTGAALPAGAAGGAAGSHSAGSGSAACAAPPRQTGVVGADAPGAQLRPIAFTFVVEAVHHAAIQRGEKTSEGRSSCKISATSQWRKLVAGDLVCARRGMGGPRETYLVCEVERPPTTFGCIDELYEANAENGSQRYLPGVESLEHFRAVYAKFGAVTSQATWEGLDFRFLGQGNIVERQGKLFWAPPANTGAGNGEAAGPVVPGRQPEEANELEAADGPGLRCPGQWDESDRMAEDVPDLAAAPAASSAGQHGEPNKRGREEDGASFDVSMRDQEVIGECGEESGSDCQSEGAAAAAPAEILVNVRGRGGDGASHAVSMRDQEAIRRYRPRERKRVPLTKAEMQYLVNRYRERHGEACAKPPDEREIGHIISSGQSNDVKALSMLVDATQVRSFFRCFLDPDRQAVPLELKLGMVVVLTGGGAEAIHGNVHAKKSPSSRKLSSLVASSSPSRPTSSQCFSSSASPSSAVGVRRRCSSCRRGPRRRPRVRRRRPRRFNFSVFVLSRSRRRFVGVVVRSRRGTRRRRGRGNAFSWITARQFPWPSTSRNKEASPASRGGSSG